MEQKKAIISVIIPVFNGEKYLRKCLNSLTTQTIQTFETIIINDGSTDNTEKIIDEYCRHHSNFVTVNQNNQGVSAARNKGLEMAQGKYILFVDSDDYLIDNMLEKMLTKATEDQSDIVVCNYFTCYRDNKYTINNQYINSEPVHNYEGIRQVLLLSYNAQPWNKLYKKEIFLEHGIKFPLNITYGEDLWVNFRCFFAAKQISFVTEALYGYTQNSQSITYLNKIHYISELLWVINNIRYILKYHIDFNLKYKEEIEAFELRAFIVCLLIYFRQPYKTLSSNVGIEYRNAMIQQFQFHLKQVLFNRYILNKNKCKFILYRLKLLNIVYFCFRSYKQLIN